jgi:hypothetical protein
MTVPQLAR